MRQFRKLVDQHKQRIYGFALYYSGNSEDAEEITQDVLFSLWRHLHTAQPDKLPAWIMRGTRNTCIDAIRNRQNYRALVVPENQDMLISETIAGDDDPVQQVESADFRRLVELALQHLSEPYRTIVICREIQDMTYEEIVDTTGLPLKRSTRICIGGVKCSGPIYVRG